MSNFIQDCIEGNALLTEIDDYVDQWHESDTPLSIFRFLGMSKREYALYVLDEAYLALIVTSHRNNGSIGEVIKEQSAMAARSNDPKKSARLEKWLRDENLWD